MVEAARMLSMEMEDIYIEEDEEKQLRMIFMGWVLDYVDAVRRFGHLYFLNIFFLSMAELKILIGIKKIELDI